MSTPFDEVQEQARRLSAGEKAALARILIEELEASVDDDTEQSWLTEAQRRYGAYLKGEMEAIPGEVVMRRARERLK